VREWDYPELAGQSAKSRLARLAGRAQFISNKGSFEETQQYLAAACEKGDFTFQALPYRNHTDTWVLRDIAERAALRTWGKKLLAE